MARELVIHKAGIERLRTRSQVEVNDDRPMLTWIERGLRVFGRVLLACRLVQSQSTPHIGRAMLRGLPGVCNQGKYRVLFVEVTCV